MIAYKEKNEKKSIKYLKLTQTYLDKNPKFKTADLTNVINFHEFWPASKQTVNMPVPEGELNGFKLKATKHNFYVHFRNGEYQSAFKMLEKDKVFLSGTIDAQIEYDLLNVLVNGKILLEQVPVTYLLFLEKQLTDLKTLVGKVPTLDEAEEWSFDESTGVYKSQAVRTTRTQKVQKENFLQVKHIFTARFFQKAEDGQILSYRT